MRLFEVGREESDTVTLGRGLTLTLTLLLASLFCALLCACLPRRNRDAKLRLDRCDVDKFEDRESDLGGICICICTCACASLSASAFSSCSHFTDLSCIRLGEGASRSFAVELLLAKLTSPTPTVLSHHFPITPTPAALGSHA